MTPLQYFRLLAPEFASVADEVVTVWLGIAATLANVSCLTAEPAAMAQALYAAHSYSLSLRSGTGGSAAPGPVTREREGDLERAYGAVKGSDTLIGSTSYGLQYRDLTLPCSGLGILTRGPVL